jgi:protein-disulfide isomerase
MAAIALLAGRVLHGRFPDYRQESDGRLDPGLFAELAASGQWVGPRTAAAVILVYSDYACGFCAQLHSTLETLRMRYPQHVAVVIKHFVDPSSLQTFRVASAAECASEQGRFAEYHAAAFENAKVLRYSDGWRMLADAVGVPDQDAFVLCVEGRRYDDRIAEQYEEGEYLGVKVTPTLFVNGFGIAGVPGMDVLDSLIAKQFPDRR